MGILALSGTFAVGFLLLTLVVPSLGQTPASVPVSLGLGVAFFMVLSLFVNAIGPPLGIDRPLAEPTPALVTAGLLVILYGAAVTRKGERNNHGPIRDSLRRISFRTVVSLILGALLVPLAVFSVKSVDYLNDSFFSELSVALVLLYIPLGWLVGRKDNSFLAQVGVLVSAPLALILLVSQRSDIVMGVDMSYELWIANEVLSVGHWQAGILSEPYNVTASLTTLPSWLHATYGLDVLAFLKVYSAVLFSFVPFALFLYFRRFLPPTVSFWSALLPLGTVAFYELPLLARQEIAMLLLSVVLILWTRKRTLGTSVLLLLSIGGLIVSHYATALIFLIAALSAGLLTAILKPENNHNTMETRSVALLTTVPLVGLVGFYLWYAISTGAVWTNIGSVLQNLVRTGLLEASSSYTLSLAAETPPGWLSALTQVVAFAIRGSILLGVLGYLLVSRGKLSWRGSFALVMAGIAGIVATLPYLAWQAYTFERLYFQALIVLAPFAFLVGKILPERLAVPHFRRFWTPIAVVMVFMFILIGTKVLPAAIEGSTGTAVQFDLSGPTYQRFYTSEEEVSAVSFLSSIKASLVYADRYGVLRLVAYGGYIDFERYQAFGGTGGLVGAPLALQLRDGRAPPRGSYIYLRAENVIQGVWRYGPTTEDVIQAQDLWATLEPRSVLIFQIGHSQVWRVT
ncbi:MAG: DUF2206 domain-containing protein [Thermoplasmata archaeon]